MAEKKIIEEGGVKTLWKRIRTALSGKADSAHTHTISQVISLQGELDSKIEPVNTVATSSSLPTISIGQMKFFYVGLTRGTIKLPSGGTYICTYDPILGTAITKVASGGSIIVEQDSDSKTNYGGFYIRIS